MLQVFIPTDPNSTDFERGTVLVGSPKGGGLVVVVSVRGAKEMSLKKRADLGARLFSRDGLGCRRVVSGAGLRSVAVIENNRVRFHSKPAKKLLREWAGQKTSEKREAKV